MEIESNNVEYLDGEVFRVYYPGNIEEAVIKAIKRGNIWEKKLLDHYKNLIKEGDTVLDIGAYLGTHSIAFSQLVGAKGNVLSFEPQENIFKLFKKTVRFNRIDNIKLFKMAVYNKNGTVTFSNTDTGKASISHIRSRLSNATKKTVKTITVDSLKLNKCKLIKIDVEKGEWVVLEGANNTIIQHRPIIFIEIFKTQPNLLLLRQFSNKYDYTYKNVGGADFIMTPRKYKS